MNRERTLIVVNVDTRHLLYGDVSCIEMYVHAFSTATAHNLI